MSLGGTWCAAHPGVPWGPRRAGPADSRPAGAGERCGGRPGLILGFLPLGAMGNFHLALPPRAGTARFLWLARCCDLS